MRKLIIFLFVFFISYQAYTQDITNTLGTDGEFVIKDGSSTFFTLEQANGYIKLPYSPGSTEGSVFKGAERFLHNYAPSGSVGYNTFLGINAGNFTMLGTGDYSSYNTGIGPGSLSSLTTGSYNTALGYGSLRKNSAGVNNTAIGYYSLYSNTTGILNTAIGMHSLFTNTEGTYNTAVGFKSLYSNTTANYNTAVGYKSLRNNTTGSYNTAVGDSSLLNNTTGDYNTSLGSKSGIDLTSGSNNTFIGYNANNGNTLNNSIVLGNSDIDWLFCETSTITSLSDARDKKNINDLTLGLNFITQLKPRQFNWDRREWYEDNKSDGSKMEEELTAGFIAQELDEVQQSENAEWLNLVYKGNPEKLETTTGNLLPVMVKAIQELEAENNELKEKNSKLEVRLFKLEQMQNVLFNEIEKLNSKDGVVTKNKISNDN